MDSLGESNTLPSDVIDLAVSPDPGISKNPSGSESEVGHSEEGDGAHMIIASVVVQLEVQDVLYSGNVEGLSIDGEDKVGNGLGLVARDGVELIGEVVGGTNLLDDLNYYLYTL